MKDLSRFCDLRTNSLLRTHSFSDSHRKLVPKVKLPANIYLLKSIIEKPEKGVKYVQN